MVDRFSSNGNSGRKRRRKPFVRAFIIDLSSIYEYMYVYIRICVSGVKKESVSEKGMKNKKTSPSEWISIIRNATETRYYYYVYICTTAATRIILLHNLPAATIYRRL